MERKINTVGAKINTVGAKINTVGAILTEKIFGKIFLLQ